jgi:hypothetical protein
MKGLVLSLDTTPPEAKEEPKTTSSDDNLGTTLQSKWNLWLTTRRFVEEEWLKDLRSFNQQNEPDQEQLSKFHSHIYIGLTRTKCMSAHSRITDIMFQSKDKHWGIEPTPIPESELATDPNAVAFMDEMTERAKKMETEIEDQLFELKYEEHVKSAILEACIIGTGCVKGVIPSVKKTEKWVFANGDWDIVKTETQAPLISSPSIFDIYPDPYANCVEDMSGLFERHVVNRNQLSELKEDERFDSVKIDEILRTTDKGNHVPLYHEVQRRNIANLQDSTAQAAERYDLLEYWGQVSGRLLQSVGIHDGIEETETYWCNVWTCMSKTLLAKVVPMKKQRIPYNFFIYNKVPHQFWGISPARMMRHTQATLNGSVRSLLDGMAMSAAPLAEVNVTMLQDGQDPKKIVPGMIYLRDSGDPSVPAVRFFQPNIPTGQLMQMAEMFKGYADDETALPAYTYGDNSNEINSTAKGMSMQMSAASLPVKAVVKNLEDGLIRPLITSLFDWNMQWSDKEDIKGDMEVQVLGTSALMAKEVKSQQLMQFLNLTANELDNQYVDRKYLLTQIAKSLEIDTDKAVPDQMPEQAIPQQEQPQISPVDQAKAELLIAQKELAKANIDKIIAETANKNIDSQFSAIQAGAQVLSLPEVISVSDSLMKSAGYKDHDGYPLVEQAVQQRSVNPGLVSHDMNIEQNTHPLFPANPQDAKLAEHDMMQTPTEVQPNSPMVGQHTMQHEQMM